MEVITTIGTIATAVGVVIVGFLRYRDRRETAAENHDATLAADAARLAVEDANAKLIEIDGKIFNLGKAVDGRLTALIAAIEKNAALRVEAALAEGKLAGVATEKAEAAENGHRRNDDPEPGAKS
jgi:hypothetical protein